MMATLRLMGHGDFSVIVRANDGVKAVQTDADGNERELFIPAKTVAVTLGLDENHELGEALKPLVNEVYLVGDCETPGRIADATKMGYRAACAL